MNNELYHHGIKGMKWGVRRYQNYDGTLTPAGRKRAAVRDKENEGISSANKKKLVAASVAAVTASAAAYYAHKHPETIGKVMSQFKGMKVSDLSQKAVNAGKVYVKQSVEGIKEGVKEGIKEGVKEGIKEAPKKATKAVITGVVLNQTKKALDSVVGKEESAKIFQANDNKKIGKFWKVSDDDKDDE